VGWPFQTSRFYKDFTLSRSFKILKVFIHPSEGSSLAPRLISSGGKMERMPMPRAMGMALECFQKILHQKGEF